MSQHPETDDLLQYLLTPADAEGLAIAEHLTHCSECRLRAVKLSGLSQQLRHRATFSVVSPTSSNVTEYEDFEQIAHYLEGRLDDAQEQQVRQQLDTSPTALKAALHYATHSSAMRRNAPDFSPALSPAVENENVASADMKANKKPPAPNKNILDTLAHALGQWLDWKMPVWISAGATALVVFTLSMLILPSNDMQDTSLHLAQYQDEALITFTPETAQRPGMGFFNTAPVHQESFGSVKISLDKDTLQMQWPAVKQARSYQVTLSVYRAAEPQVLFSKTVATPDLRLTHFTPETGHRYEWEISGTRTDNTAFKTRGGFVIK